LETFANTFKCNCTVKMHDKDDTKCSGKDCDCETIEGYLDMTDGSQLPAGRAPILRGAGFTGDMDAAITNIRTGYNNLNDMNKDSLVGKIKEIRVIGGENIAENYSYVIINGQVIMTFPDKCVSGNVMSYIQFFIIPDL